LNTFLTLIKASDFWVPLFSFLGTLSGTAFVFAKWLLRAYYVTKHKADLEKHRLNTTEEILKKDNATMIAQLLKDVVDDIKPTLEKHDLIIKDFTKAIERLNGAEIDNTTMSRELKIQYGNLASEVLKFSARAEMIETAIKILKEKSPNIFVTTKKP
jgi:hypothetical protein